MAYAYDGGYMYPAEQLPHHALPYHHAGGMPTYVQLQHPSDAMYPHMPFQEHPDLMHYSLMADDYEDSTEISTRPRLTKEQVEILEQQFQAQPKPSSATKKHLATRTSLSLPRVANWFQNRRAKAKQQLKQQEYEEKQRMEKLGKDPKGNYAGEGAGSTSRESSTDQTEGATSPHKLQSTTISTETLTKMESLRSPSRTSQSKEACYESLDRALSQGKQEQWRLQSEGHHAMSMPPPEVPFQSAGLGGHDIHVTGTAQWSNNQDSIGGWASSSPATTAHVGFDFGFDQVANSIESTAQPGQEFTVSPEDWSSYSADTPQPANDFCAMVSPPMPMSMHLSSRRGSGAEDLVNNFDSFALVGTPPVPGSTGGQTPSIRSTEGEIDLASRRKRPRPAALTSAALTSASLRSRSYGALSSSSPGFRNGPPSVGQLRHVKSTGHNLNGHYAGIRKPSLPTKSPLNVSTFAEADTLRMLMAQSAAGKPQGTPMTEVGMPTTDFNQQGLPDHAGSVPTPTEAKAQYKQIQSPPVTPFQSDFIMQTGIMQPPLSAASQYATFAECTPPYSAGPMTDSTCSWSDAPLHSPDLPIFSQGAFMQSMPFTHQDPNFQQYVLQSDSMTDMAMHQHISDEKKAEFYMHEFPGQKEEHATVAQMVSQQRPKNYSFAHLRPADFDS